MRTGCLGIHAYLSGVLVPEELLELGEVLLLPLPLMLDPDVPIAEERSTPKYE